LVTYKNAKNAKFAKLKTSNSWKTQWKFAATGLALLAVGFDFAGLLRK
jgi:hypothetical protein